ncbi:hypothetical protein H1R20_g9094, partial [Candolleomyces eurysporus]
MEGFEANAERLENGDCRTENTSFDDRGCQEEGRNTVSATRNPLRNLTNFNLHSAGQPQSLYASIALPTLQQDASDATSEEVDELFNQYIVWPSDDDAVPQQDSASDSQHSTNTTRSREKGRVLNDLDEDDFYANEVGVYYGANVDDSGGDAPPVPESLPARAAATGSEVISPYPSELQDFPASSPLAQVSGTQSRSSKASSLKKSQSRPSEGPSPSTDASKEQASTNKKTSSRKRRLSESKDQPSKRPASESKVQSIAVSIPQPSSAHAATPSTAPLPATGALANAAAVESAAPSRAGNEGTRQQEASEATTIPNAIPAVSNRAVARATTSSTAPRHIPVSSGSHGGTTSANASDTVCVSRPNVQLPELASSATSEGVDQRGAQEVTNNAKSSVSSSVVIQTSAAPLAQPVPVNATRRANAVAPSNMPTAVPVVSSILVSSPDSEAPTSRGENQGAGKQGASTKGKGRRGAGSRSRGNENSQTASTVSPPLYGGMQLVWHSENPDAVVGHTATGSSASAQPSDANEKKPENGYILYRNTMFSLHWSAEKVKIEWRNMPESEKNIWCSKADLKRVEEAAKRQGNSCGQSISSAVPSPSPAPLVQNNQAQSSVDLSTVPGPSTAPLEGSIQYSQVGSSGAQQQQPQAPAMPPMQQFTPDPRYQAPPDGFSATHYPTFGGHYHYPATNANQLPPSYYHMPQVSIPFNGYPPQGMLMAPPPNFWAHARPGYGIPAPPPNAHYSMNQPPATNNAHDDNANANAGPSLPATNANSSFNPPPQGSFDYHQAAAMNANTVTGPSVSSTPNNVPWGQRPQSWTPTP